MSNKSKWIKAIGVAATVIGVRTTEKMQRVTTTRQLTME